MAPAASRARPPRRGKHRLARRCRGGPLRCGRRLARHRACLALIFLVVLGGARGSAPHHLGGLGRGPQIGLHLKPHGGALGCCWRLRLGGLWGAAAGRLLGAARGYGGGWLLGGSTAVQALSLPRGGFVAQVHLRLRNPGRVPPRAHGRQAASRHAGALQRRKRRQAIAQRRDARLRRHGRRGGEPGGRGDLPQRRLRCRRGLHGPVRRRRRGGARDPTALAGLEGDARHRGTLGRDADAVQRLLQRACVVQQQPPALSASGEPHAVIPGRHARQLVPGLHRLRDLLGADVADHQPRVGLPHGVQLAGAGAAEGQVRRGALVRLQLGLGNARGGVVHAEHAVLPR
mmetsp:Transcript_3434/g.8958  ORF Transcript_3434/g.8958 Transcript_3434/m.8958 type:complete len:345 (+) Transcript_3434:544-1578(+)